MSSVAVIQRAIGKPDTSVDTISEIGPRGVFEPHTQDSAGRLVVGDVIERSFGVDIRSQSWTD